MASQRHNDLAGPDHRTGASDDHLDAARACILDVGWRRTTLTEVARRAGVSRMTIYRTWSDMPQLLGDLMTREWQGVVTEARHRLDTGGADEGGDQATLLAELLVTVAGALRRNELFVRIVELDPELILPYLLSRRGRSQDAIIAVASEIIRDGQAAGAIREGDPTTLARALVLAAHGFVLSAHTMVDDEVTEDALDAELRHVARRMLEP